MLFYDSRNYIKALYKRESSPTAFFDAVQIQKKPVFICLTGNVIIHDTVAAVGFTSLNVSGRHPELPSRSARGQGYSDTYIRFADVLWASDAANIEPDD